MKKPFPLCRDRDVFKFATKSAFRMLEKNLIEHKNDDDLDTDEEIVDEHIDLCHKQLKDAIDEFLSGEPLKLVRNIRGHFSGIERIDCDEEEDQNSTPDSSWYEMCSTVNN